jgi:hypothetical protein
LLLQQRKATLLADYEKRIPVSNRNDPEKDALVKKIVRAVEEAQSEQAVDDCDSKFNLHFPLDEVDISESGFKRPKRLSLYSMCRKAGLNAVAKHFGLAPHLLGENLQATYKVFASHSISLTGSECKLQSLPYSMHTWTNYGVSTFYFKVVLDVRLVRAVLVASTSG